MAKGLAFDGDVLREMDEARQKMPERVCMLCVDKKRTFRMIELLEEHIRLWHLDYTPWQCSLCDKSFANRLGWFAHAKTKHRGIEHAPKLTRHMYKEKLCRLLCICCVQNTVDPIVKARLPTIGSALPPAVDVCQSATSSSRQDSRNNITFSAEKEEDANKNEAAIESSTHKVPCDNPVEGSQLNSATVAESFLVQLTEKMAESLFILPRLAPFCVRCLKKDPAGGLQKHALEEFRTPEGRHAHAVTVHHAKKNTARKVELKCFPDESPLMPIDEDGDDRKVDTQRRCGQRKNSVATPPPGRSPSGSCSSVDTNSIGMAPPATKRPRGRPPKSSTPTGLAGSTSNGEQQLQHRQAVNELRGDRSVNERTVCTVCGIHVLWSHASSHLLYHAQAFRCSRCPAKFGRKRDANIHARDEHPDSGTADEIVENKQVELDAELTKLAHQCFAD